MTDPWSAMAQSTANLPALGLGLIGMKERNADRDAQLALMREKADETIGLKRDQLATTEETAKQMALDREAKLPVHRQIAHPSEIAAPKIATEKTYGKAGMDALSSTFDMMNEISASSPTSTKGDVYVAVKSAWPALREDFIDRARKHLESGKLSETEQKRLSALYDQAVYDKTGDSFLDEGIFSNTARAMKMEEENTRTAQIAARGGIKGNWSEPYQMGGAWVQKNDATGEVRQAVSRPPVGISAEGSAAKHDSYANRLERQADNEAARETRTKFPTTPTITIGPDGKPTIAYPNNPEAQQFYLNRKKEIADAKLSRAVKQKALPKEYLSEDSVPKAYSSPYESAEAVKEAVKSGKITKEAGIKILRSDFGMK